MRNPTAKETEIVPERDVKMRVGETAFTGLDVTSFKEEEEEKPFWFLSTRCFRTSAKGKRSAI